MLMLKHRPKILIQIVTWNSRPYLKACLDSVIISKYQDWSLLVIDNGSRDGTIELIRNEYPNISLLENRQNLGFALAHNQGIRITDSDYVLIMNPDIILTPGFLGNIFAGLNDRPDYGSAVGKLLKFNFNADESREPIYTNTIDSAGLLVQRSRRFTNRGEGETDNGQYNYPSDVFGPSGAIALYRRTALEDVKLRDEYFDNDFFAYKEDIDLAWRMQRAGWRSIYLPDAVAYHHREARVSETNSALKRERRNRSRFINSYSYKNHLLTLIKNERAEDFIKDAFWIIFYELRKLIYIILYEPKTLSTLWATSRQLASALKKRRLIKGRQSGRGLDIRQWFVRT